MNTVPVLVRQSDKKKKNSGSDPNMDLSNQLGSGRIRIRNTELKCTGTYSFMPIYDHATHNVGPSDKNIPEL